MTLTRQVPPAASIYHFWSNFIPLGTVSVAPLFSAFTLGR